MLWSVVPFERPPQLSSWPEPRLAIKPSVDVEIVLDQGDGLGVAKYIGQLVFHRRYERAVGLRRDNPLLSAMGLENVFLAPARSCCRWRDRQCAVRPPSPRADAGSIWQSLPGPERGSARSVLLPPRRRNPPPGGVRLVFAGEHRLEPFLDQLAPGPLDSGDAGVQRRGDPAVAPAFARIRYVRLQQDARLRQQLGEHLPLRIQKFPS